MFAIINRNLFLIKGNPYIWDISFVEKKTRVCSLLFMSWVQRKSLFELEVFRRQFVSIKVNGRKIVWNLLSSNNFKRVGYLIYYHISYRIFNLMTCPFSSISGWFPKIKGLKVPSEYFFIFKSFDIFMYKWGSMNNIT